MPTLRPRGISTPPQSDNAELQRWIDAVSSTLHGLPPAPQIDDSNLQNWFYEVKDSIDGLPFSTFSTSDGPNQSAVTAPEGFIGVEVGSSSTKFWFKESGSTSTGWSPWDSGKVTDFDLRVSAGVVSGISAVNKFGENTDIDTGTDPEDVWSKGGIWIPPTAASIHTIVSSHVSDDGGASTATHTGARTVRVYGLKTWDTSETSEDVTLSGTSEMVTANSYVIIHRLQVITSGTSDTNRGIIEAVEAASSEISSAEILAEHGQSHMAIYGISSLDRFFVADWDIDLNKSGQAGTAQVDFCVRENADEASSTWNIKEELGVSTTGSSFVEHTFHPYLPVVGPAIIKVQVREVSGSNTNVSSGFEGYLVKNTVVL